MLFIGLPRKAFGTLVGYINGVDLTDSTINAVMTTTDDGENIRVEATIKDLPPLTGESLMCIYLFYLFQIKIA